MDSCERVLAVLNGEQPDRVPIDFCAIGEVANRLINDLGTKDYDSLLERLHVDFRRIEPIYLTSHTRDCGDGTYADVWNMRVKEVNKNGGKVYERLPGPLVNLDTIELVSKHYRFPIADMVDCSNIEKQLERYKDYAKLCGPWTPFLCHLFDMRGLEQTLVDMAAEPEYVKFLVKQILDFYYQVAIRIFEIVKGRAHICFIGDDFATQRGMMISIGMFRYFFKDAFRKLFGLAKDYGLKVMMHSCGAITDLIPDLIEIGADIINPVQVSAAGMDIRSLVSAFGDKVCFHGAIDQQYLLPFGTPDEVRASVRETIRAFHGYRYFLCSSHDLIENIPTENVVAMYDEAAIGV